MNRFSFCNAVFISFCLHCKFLSYDEVFCDIFHTLLCESVILHKKKIYIDVAVRSPVNYLLVWVFAYCC